MENASKALIMAGSILIALLVIGIVTFMYGKFADVQQTITDVDEEEKAVNYNKFFEEYNRTIYGSELLSLANLQQDYNEIKVNLKGFNDVTIKVNIKTSLVANEKTYLSAGTKSIGQIRTARNLFETDIDYYETETDSKNKTIKDYAQMSNREIAKIFGIENSQDIPDYDIDLSTIKFKNNKTIQEEVEKYKNIKTTYTEFKRKTFKCTSVKYDELARITEMKYEET